MPKYGYLVVEGPHDIELVYRLLSPFGFERVRLESDLDPFWISLIPRSFPHGGDLQKRVPVPLFLQNQNLTHSLAIQSAIGDSRLVPSVQETMTILDRTEFTGVGVMLDADSNIDPVDRFEEIRNELRDMGYAFPDRAGEVKYETPRLGGFVLPDNQNRGTLEDILIDCASHGYSNLLVSANAHVNAALNDGSLTRDDLRDLRKPAGVKKAIVSSIASVLRPGKAVQVSLQDNGWLRGSALSNPRLRLIQSFLCELFDLPTTNT